VTEFPVVGLHPLSLDAYPGKLSAVLVTPGCNFRCPMCLHPELILNESQLMRVPEEEIIKTLHPRMEFLDGVCIRGGEPTLHRTLLAFLYRLKSIGAETKIDTNGSRPKMLRIFLDRRIIDYIALDLKAQPNRYPEVTRYKIKPETIIETIKLLRRGSVDHEFKITPVPGIHTQKDVEELAQLLMGSKRFAIEQFQPWTTENPECRDIEPYSEGELRQFRDLVAPYFAETILRL